MNETREIRFPCDALPENAAEARLLGVYPQRQEGLFMQRVKVPGGRIAPAQWRVLAELSARFAPGFPLRLTTRQDVELHGLTRENIPAVQQGLAQAGLTGLGACGDTLRNITACPGNAACEGSVDYAPLEEAIRNALESLPWIRNLPRKFKISISGCERACARPWINDIGLVAHVAHDAPRALADGSSGVPPSGPHAESVGSPSFEAIVGGSLGAKPGTGMAYGPRLTPSQVVPFVLATLRLFNVEGDRANRTRARLRHVRERLGDESFRTKLSQFFEEELRSSSVPTTATSPAPCHQERHTPCGTPHALGRLHPPLGELATETALRLADALEQGMAESRIGVEHDLLIYGDRLPEFSPELREMMAGPTVVACPGTTWCARGIADARAAGGAIRTALPPGTALSVCLSGCPNNCAHAGVADIGFVGRVRTISGARQQCFQLLVGGGMGKTPALALELHPAVPASRTDAVVAWLAQQYRLSRQHARETFGEFTAREHETLARGVAAVLQESEEKS